MELKSRLTEEEREFPSYYDLKYSKSSKIFESYEIEGLSPDEIKAGESVYEEVLKKIKEGDELDEGFFGALVGGAAGALAGPAIGRAICKALGIDENGHLGKLLTSRLVTTAIGITLGK